MKNTSSPNFNLPSTTVNSLFIILQKPIFILVIDLHTTLENRLGIPLRYILISRLVNFATLYIPFHPPFETWFRDLWLENVINPRIKFPAIFFNALIVFCSNSGMEIIFHENIKIAFFLKIIAKDCQITKYNIHNK